MYLRKFSEIATCVLMSLCMFSCASPPALSDTHSKFQTGNEYAKVNVRSAKLDLTPIGIQDCLSCFQLEAGFFLAVCRNPGVDSPEDYGVRLYLIQDTAQKLSVLFESHGYMDSYYLRPSVFKIVGTNELTLILAEAGAEFSYGIGVYRLNNQQMRYLGILDVAVEGESNPESAVPFIKIAEKQGALTFTFTKDVVMSDDEGNYEVIPMNEIQYSYSKDRLMKIMRPKQ